MIQSEEIDMSSNLTHLIYALTGLLHFLDYFHFLYLLFILADMPVLLLIHVYLLVLAYAIFKMFPINESIRTDI